MERELKEWMGRSYDRKQASKVAMYVMIRKISESLSHGIRLMVNELRYSADSKISVLEMVRSQSLVMHHRYSSVIFFASDLFSDLSVIEKSLLSDLRNLLLNFDELFNSSAKKLPVEKIGTGETCALLESKLLVFQADAEKIQYEASEHLGQIMSDSSID